MLIFTPRGTNNYRGITQQIFGKGSLSSFKMFIAYQTQAVSTEEDINVKFVFIFVFTQAQLIQGVEAEFLLNQQRLSWKVRATGGTMWLWPLLSLPFPGPGSFTPGHCCPPTSPSFKEKQINTHFTIWQCVWLFKSHSIKHGK